MTPCFSTSQRFKLSVVGHSELGESLTNELALAVWGVVDASRSCTTYAPVVATDEGHLHPDLIHSRTFWHEQLEQCP
jgi:hypothetical protein